MASLAQRWESQSPSNLQKRSIESMEWFKDKAKNLKVRPRPLLRGTGQTARSLEHGKMYMFFYDAKYKGKLPYWDKFPCMIPIDVSSKRVLGINLHYLAPRHRILLLDGLFQETNNEEFDETTQFRVFYETIKAITRLKYAKPCLKWYLTARIKSRLTEVPAERWEIVAMMPTAQWQNSHANHVYAESRNRF